MRARSIRMVSATSVVMLLVVLPQHGMAQPAEDICQDFAYDQKEIVKPEELRNLEAVVQAARQSGSIPPADVDKFDRFYRDFVFASLTNCRIIGGATRLTLDGIRRDYVVKELTRLGTGPIHDRIVSLALQSCIEILEGNYHPAARVNAALILASLNSREAGAMGDPGAAAVPLAQALSPLVARIEDPSESPAVKVAALVGVERHASLKGVADADKPRLVKAVLPLLAAPPTRSARISEEASRWVRCRAADTLGALGSPGADGEVLAELAKVVQEKDVDMKLASRAAMALGRLDYSQAKYENPSALAAAVARKAVQAFKDEDDQATARQEAVVKRRLKYYFTAIFVGLGGTSLQAEQPSGMLALAKEEPHRSFVAGLVERVKPMYEVFDTESAQDDTKLRVALKFQAQAVSEYIATSLEKGSEAEVFSEPGTAPPRRIGDEGANAQGNPVPPLPANGQNAPPANVSVPRGPGRN